MSDFERFLDRRSWLKGVAGLAGGAAAGSFLPGTAEAQVSNQSRPILIKGGHVISMDRNIGDIENGDVLIERGAITSVGRNLRAPNAQVVDASSKLVLPGFVDAHRHAWMTQQRSFMVPADFFGIVVKTMEPLYRPEDAYVGVLLGCVESLNAGITTMFDFAHIMFNDDFADAVIRGLREPGIRAVFGHTLPHLPSSPNALDGARRVRRSISPPTTSWSRSRWAVESAPRISSASSGRESETRGKTPSTISSLPASSERSEFISMRFPSSSCTMPGCSAPI